MAAGGDANSVYVSDSSRLTVTGGSVRFLSSNSSESPLLSGGSVERVEYTLGFEMQGGIVGTIARASHLVLSAGSVTGSVSMFLGDAVFDGASIASVSLLQDATATLSAGCARRRAPLRLRQSGDHGRPDRRRPDGRRERYRHHGALARAGRLLTGGESRATIEGGALLQGLRADDTSSVRITRGQIFGGITATGSSTVTLVGIGFAVDGVAVPFGALGAEFGVLTGTLASGEPIDVVFARGGTSNGVIVVEPLPVLIANGSAPRDPANVLGPGVDLSYHQIVVRNAGLRRADPFETPCAAPGDATDVLAAGAQIGRDVLTYDDSTITLDAATAVGGGIVTRGARRRRRSTERTWQARSRHMIRPRCRSAAPSDPPICAMRRPSR